MGRELGRALGAPARGAGILAARGGAARAGRSAPGLAALAVFAVLAVLAGALAAPGGARADVAVHGAPTTESGTLQAHTWTHPVPPGGRGRYLVIGVSVLQEGGRAPQVEALTFARLPLVFLGAETHDGHARAELWGLPDPPEGDQPVSVRLSGPGGFVAGALVFTGVAASRPEVRGARGISGAAVFPVAGPAGGRVFGVYAADGEAAPAHAPGQLGHWSLRAKAVGAAASAASGPAATLGWQGTGPDQAWAAAAVVLAPAPGGAGRGNDAGAGTGGAAGAAGAVDGGGGAPGGGGPAADAGGAGTGAAAPVEYDVGCGCALGGPRRGGGAGPLLLVFAAAGLAARGRPPGRRRRR